MFRPLAQLVCGIGIGIGCLYGPAAAQLYDKPRPVSNPGGYANTELRSVYRSGIGQGYSVDSINRLAMNRTRSNVPSVGQLIGSPASKPFSGYSPGPTVSPWMNLFREDLDGNSDFNYQTLVQPQLRQQRFNEQMQRRSMEISQRLQSISAQSDFNPQGSTTQPPTGHQTVFMYYGHYYPAMSQRRR